MVNHFFNPSLKQFFPDMMHGYNACANDNKTKLDQAADEYVKCMRTLDETLFRGLQRDIKNIFEDIRQMPDDLAIKALECVTAEHQKTIDEVKEKIYGQ